MMFTLITLAIAVVTVVLLLRPLFSKEHSTLVERDRVNIQSAATKLAELKAELKDGLISEEQFQQYQLELETTALEDLQNNTATETKEGKGNKALAIIIALFVPILSIAIYQKIGDETALDAQLQADETALATQEMEKMLLTVEKSILENPEDVEGRIALAQVYIELERYSDAVNVYHELNTLLPNEPDILVNYAEALARSHANRLTGKPIALLNKALEIAPKHGRALWLAGFAEQQAENKTAAIMHWRHLLEGMEAGSEAHKQLTNLLAELEGTETTTEKSTVTVLTEQSLQVTVSLLPELETKVAPDTVMFIYARAAEGPPMPLAVHKGLAKDLPITVTLDDSMAMMPQMSLSSFPNVIVGARLSSNGQPQGQTGDYEGFSGVIEVLTNPVVNILIDSIKP